jgi:hypothetical protein
VDADVEVEIAPEPAADVRGAILAAVEQLDGESRESAWWRAGVAESVADDFE